MDLTHRYATVRPVANTQLRATPISGRLLLGRQRTGGGLIGMRLWRVRHRKEIRPLRSQLPLPALWDGLTVGPLADSPAANPEKTRKLGIRFQAENSLHSTLGHIHERRV